MILFVLEGINLFIVGMCEVIDVFIVYICYDLLFEGKFVML